MLRCSRRFTRPNRLAILAILLAATIPAPTTFALILGGEGNKPIDDPGWPAGAAIVFNQPGRIAYWEGPPFGGGQWHAECRGDAKLFNAALASFANIDAKSKRLVVHDGVGHSFWLNMNNEPPKAAAAQMDWSFMVWQLANWKQLGKLPPALKPADMGDANNGPPTHIDVYTGGHIQWVDVVVPKGVEVIDDRLEAHGVSAADGTVLEGTITDLDTKKPLVGRVEVQLIDPQKKGGYHYSVIGQTDTDEKGKWRLKNAPAGWVRIVLLAEGYTPRVVGFGKYTGEPGWHPFNGALLRSATITGRVADADGKPLADVDVWLHDVASHGENYQTANDFRTTTNADGRFQFDEVPAATARIALNKKGYCRPGFGPTINVPAKDVALAMTRSAQVNVTVDFASAKPPESYLVEIEPAGGNVVGSWGGSSQIDKKNRVTFNDVPPGRYVLRGHPNPSSEDEVTKPITIELTGGATEEIQLVAKAGKKSKPAARPKATAAR
jgi:Carboxypeptidase regulatory-like domain